MNERDQTIHVYGQHHREGQANIHYSDLLFRKIYIELSTTICLISKVRSLYYLNSIKTITLLVLYCITFEPVNQYKSQCKCYPRHPARIHISGPSQSGIILYNNYIIFQSTYKYLNHWIYTRLVGLQESRPSYCDCAKKGRSCFCLTRTRTSRE